MKDLFKNLELLPSNVLAIINEFKQHEDCEKLVERLNEVGYTCEFDLGAIPYNLSKIILSPTDYVIYDRANDRVLMFESDGTYIVYGDKEQALEDCYGNEEVILCNELPLHHQKKLEKQIIKNSKDK